MYSNLHHLFLLCLLAGVNTLAYGHYRITRKVNNVALIERSGEDMVLSAAEAARDLIRPGRPWPHMFPLGEDPVAATRATEVACADAAADRVQAAVETLRAGQMPTSQTLNSALVHAIVSAVMEEHYRGALDLDFVADDIVALHDVAVSFRDEGFDNEELYNRLHILVGALREMLVEEEEDGAPDGDVEVAEDE